MVLFKRRVVEIPPPPRIPTDADTPVWIIPQTLEYFVSYDEYLKRMDFYLQKKFICELTGTSCLTFFQALTKETCETDSLLQHFPEQAKAPVLRQVQYSLVSRLDQLVDEIYTPLKDDFFVGEIVYTRMRDHRLGVLIRSKTLPADNMPLSSAIYQCEPLATMPFSLSLNAAGLLELTGRSLLRDRKVFSKLTLRAFIKLSAAREIWAGAPWIVKPEYVEKYDLASEPPPHIRRLYALRTPIAESGALNIDADSLQATSLNQGDMRNVGDAYLRYPPIAPATSKSRGALEISPGIDMGLDGIYGDTNSHGGRRRRTPAGRSGTAAIAAAMFRDKTEDLKEYIRLQVNDSRIIPWPRWHTDPLLADVEKEKAMGKLLELWTFAHFFRDMLSLGAFNFDDLENALSNDSGLLSQLHEALLSQYVDEGSSELSFGLPQQEEEGQGRGKQRKKLKVDKEAHKQDHKEEDVADDEEASGTAHPEKIKEPGSQYITVDGTTWLERIGNRQFDDGGWQLCLICLIHEVSYIRDWREDCVKLLTRMAPVTVDEPSLESAKDGYSLLNTGEKVLALSLLMKALQASPAIRHFLENRSEEVSKLRKERAEVSKEARALSDQLRIVKTIGNDAETSMTIDDTGSNGRLTEDIATPPQLNSKEGQDKEDTPAPAEEPAQEDDAELESESKPKARGKTRAKQAKTNRKNKKNKKSQPSRKKLDEETEEPEDSEEPNADRENVPEEGTAEPVEGDERQESTTSPEDIKKDLDNKLNELSAINARLVQFDCQRMRLLGKDRFFNRYWWLELNGVETGEEGYSMGRLWVQGPTEEETQQYLNSEKFAEELGKYRDYMVARHTQLRQRALAEAHNAALLEKERQMVVERRKEGKLSRMRERQARNEAYAAAVSARMATQNYTSRPIRGHELEAAAASVAAQRSNSGMQEGSVESVIQDETKLKQDITDSNVNAQSNGQADGGPVLQSAQIEPPAQGSELHHQPSQDPQVAQPYVPSTHPLEMMQAPPGYMYQATPYGVVMYALPGQSPYAQQVMPGYPMQMPMMMPGMMPMQQMVQVGQVSHMPMIVPGMGMPGMQQINPQLPPMMVPQYQYYPGQAPMLHPSLQQNQMYTQQPPLAYAQPPTYEQQVQQAQQAPKIEPVDQNQSPAQSTPSIQPISAESSLPQVIVPVAPQAESGAVPQMTGPVLLQGPALPAPETQKSNTIDKILDDKPEPPKDTSATEDTPTAPVVEETNESQNEANTSTGARSHIESPGKSGDKDEARAEDQSEEQAEVQAEVQAKPQEISQAPVAKSENTQEMNFDTETQSEASKDNSVNSDGEDTQEDEAMMQVDSVTENGSQIAISKESTVELIDRSETASLAETDQVLKTEEPSNQAPEFTEEGKSQAVKLMIEYKKETEGDSHIVYPYEWRFYQTPQELLDLENYLYRRGKRESLLADELHRINKSIVTSMEARMKALEITPDSTKAKEADDAQTGETEAQSIEI